MQQETLVLGKNTSTYHTKWDFHSVLSILIGVGWKTAEWKCLFFNFKDIFVWILYLTI